MHTPPDTEWESCRKPARAGGPPIVDDAARNTFRVAQALYTSADVLAREEALLFGKCWLYLGHASEVRRPHDFLTRTVAGRELIFTRTGGGELRAFLNTCRHRGAPLCRERRGARKSFACPYHGWLYDNGGKLLNVPGRESFDPRHFESGDFDLLAVPRLDTHCGFVFVNFDAAAMPLAEYLAEAGDVLATLAAHGPAGMEILPGTHDYAIPANWKLLIENSNDGYHAGPTHASYFDYVQSREGPAPPGRSASPTLVGTAALGHGLHLLGNGHSVIDTEGPWPRPCARWAPSWGEDARAEIAATAGEIAARVGPARARHITQIDKNIILFPNTMINDVMGIAVRTCHPAGPGHTIVSAWSLAPVGETAAARARRNRNYLEFFGPSGFATPDDLEMLAICQRAYESSGGTLWTDVSKGLGKAEVAVDDEEQQRYFWRRWRGLMG